MIMGQGKTTVVGPLLALCLADGKTLVMQTMPSALLEMSRNVLRGVFASLVPKRVYTIVFDRSQNDIQYPQIILLKLKELIIGLKYQMAIQWHVTQYLLQMIVLLNELSH
jgi:hypothetical protein